MDNHPILSFLAVLAFSFVVVLWSRASVAYHRRRAAETWHRLDLRAQDSGSFSEALGVTPRNKVQQRVTVGAEDE